MKVGIYKITNKINGKSYVGQSINIEKRWESHQNVSFNSNNPKYDYPLSKAFRKYGIENFKFEILETCVEEALTEREIFYYNFYKPEYCLTSPNIHFSQDRNTRAKISEALTGRTLSEEHTQKIKERMSGASNPNAKVIKAVGVEQTLFFETQMEAAHWIKNNKLAREGTEARQIAMNISRAFNGGRKSAYNFIWEEVSPSDKEFHYTKSSDTAANKKAISISKDGKVYSFNSTKEAALWLKENNYTKASIKAIQSGLSNIKLGKRKTYLGFIWV